MPSSARTVPPRDSNRTNASDGRNLRQRPGFFTACMDDLYLGAHPERVIGPCMCVPDHIDSGWLLGRSKTNVVAERRQDAKADQPVITVTESTGMVLARIAKPSDSYLPTACSLPRSPAPGWMRPIVPDHVRFWRSVTTS